MAFQGQEFARLPHSVSFTVTIEGIQILDNFDAAYRWLSNAKKVGRVLTDCFESV